MNLLFDANLSRRLVPLLKDLFQNSLHVTAAGLSPETPDRDIWEFAKNNGYIVVTADYDFVKLSEAYGPPPQVVRLDRMNYTTQLAADLLRRNAIAIAEFEKSGRPLLILRRTQA